MKIIRIFGACLTMVIALSAMVAASASAEEILFKTPEGGFPIGFDVSTPGGISVHTEGGMTLTCTTMGTNAETEQGNIETAHLGTVQLVMTGCKSTVGGIPVGCRQAPRGEGEILVDVLFHIGYFPTAKPAILVLPLGFFFTCAGTRITVSGNVIGLLVNGMGEPVEIGGKYEELYIKFFQHEGKQEHLDFTLSLTGETMENQDLKVKIENIERLAGLEGAVKLSNFKPKPVGFEI